MLFLLFRLGEDRYALDAAQIGEVLPLLDVKAVPGAPPGVAGIINYHGAPVPVIDLSALALGRPARPQFGTRIILARYAGEDGVPHWLGLIAEQATEIMRSDADAFVPSGLAGGDAPYLGPVLPDPRGLIQRIDASRFLSAAVRDALFQPLEEVLS